MKGRARQYPCRLYDLDCGQRSQGEAVLFSHLREQPDPNGGPHEDEIRRKGHDQDFDEGRGKHQIIEPLAPATIKDIRLWRSSNRRANKREQRSKLCPLLTPLPPVQSETTTVLATL